MTDDLSGPDEMPLGNVLEAALETEKAESAGTPLDASSNTSVAAPAVSGKTNDANYDFTASLRALKEGDVVKGTVVHIDKDGVLVDVGMKSEGIIRRNELSRDSSILAEEIVTVGEIINVYIMEVENHDGNLILSKKRADFESAWEKVQEAKKENRTLSAMVTDRVKGGLVVDLGIRGFVPASHVGNGSMKNNLERYVGQPIAVKVIEVDKEHKKVVLSNKMAVDEDRMSKKAETVESLTPGQIRSGMVRRLTTYGAFIDLGGIDGLLHISEMSWSRINHPQEMLKEGQDVDVVVLKIDAEAGRVSLGLKQILPDPWQGIDEHYQAGDVITGKVTRIVPYGVFVAVEGGIEGIIPNSELGSRKGGKSNASSLVDAEVEVKVMDVRPDERKMTLSLRQLQKEEDVPVRREPVQHDRQERQPKPQKPPKPAKTEHAPAPEREEQRFTIGDALRAKVEAANLEAEESAD